MAWREAGKGARQLEEMLEMYQWQTNHLSDTLVHCCYHVKDPGNFKVVIIYDDENESLYFIQTFQQCYKYLELISYLIGNMG